MNVRYGDSYIDRLFAEQDLPNLYTVISVVEKQHELPEELWLFLRVYEWFPARSGIWQYFESMTLSDADKMRSALRKFDLADLALRFEDGCKNWEDEEKMNALESWMDQVNDSVHGKIFQLIRLKRDYLKQPT